MKYLLRNEKRLFILTIGMIGAWFLSGVPQNWWIAATMAIAHVLYGFILALRLNRWADSKEISPHNFPKT